MTAIGPVEPGGVHRFTGGEAPSSLTTPSRNRLDQALRSGGGATISEIVAAAHEGSEIKIMSGYQTAAQAISKGDAPIAVPYALSNQLEGSAAVGKEALEILARAISKYET